MLTRVLRTVRLNTIDQRSQIGVAMRRLRTELVAQLGGPGEVTPAVELLLEEVCKKAVIVQAVGEYILRQETLVREGKGGPELLRVVEQHDRLQATLAGLLDKLGWMRKARPVESLPARLAREASEPLPPEPA